MKLDVDLLMALQYDLTLSTTPLEDLADSLGKPYEYVEKTLKLYAAEGVVKRYGVNLNYRAFGDVKQAALVGFKAANVDAVARKVNEFDEVRVKHNFLRNAEYQVWFTIKGRNVEEIESIVERIAIETGVTDYVVLPTKRVYKMDVKYDIRKGVSWSMRGLEPLEIPLISELGFDENFIRKLESLEISRRPFSSFVRYGYSEEEIVSVIEELIKCGIGRDFSGVLSESKIGFRENGMTVLRVSEDPERIALILLRRFPQITHLIERVANEKWNYPVYFMVHATSKEPIERIRKEVEDIGGVEEARIVYSRENLRERKNRF